MIEKEPKTLRTWMANITYRVVVWCCLIEGFAQGMKQEWGVGVLCFAAAMILDRLGDRL